MKQRNRSQVVQRAHIKEIGGVLTEAPILLVPQLWIWVIGNVVVSTCPLRTPSRREDPYEGARDLTYGFWLQGGRNADMVVALAIIYHITVFRMSYPPNGASEGGSYLSTLEYFEIAVVAALSEVCTYIEERSTQAINLDRERTFIESIADMRNELDMIDTILSQQMEIINKIICDLFTKLDENDPMGARNAREEATRKLKEGIERIKEYKARIAKINRDADKVAKTIDDMLNLSRTEASIK